MDWERFAPAFTLRRPSPLIAGLPQVREALAAEAADDGDPATGTELAQRLAGLPVDEQDEVLIDLVMGEVAVVLGHSSADELQAGRAFKDLGFDSLTALELRNRLVAATGTALPSTLIFDYPTTAALAAYLRQQISDEWPVAREPVLSELDRLESTITGLPEGSGLLTDVTARLQTLLSRLTGAQEPPRAGSVAGTLEAATADEVMDFINSQLKGE